MDTIRTLAGAVALAACLAAGAARAQTPMINELDCDQTGTDATEFVEIWTPAPNVPLTGYVLVFFNGATDQSYLTIDLSPYATDANGFLVVGNAAVSPPPAAVFPNNTLQNGADAVAIYLASPAAFPLNTPAVAGGLVDAVVYDTADPDDTGLLSVLTPGQPQIDEDQNASGITQSIFRCADGQGGPLVTGSWIAGTPTPGVTNAGPCPPANPFTLSITQDVPNCGPIVIAVAGAGAGHEIYNLVSFQCLNGQGPLFGIGTDAFYQVFTPLGFHPFHVLADGAGAYNLSIPTPCAQAYTIEAVSIDALGFQIFQVSATTGCVQISF